MATLWELFVEVSGDNSKFKRSIKDSQADLGAFEKTAATVTDKIGAALGTLGPKLTAVGIGAFILKAGQDFEQASNRIAKATGEVGKNLDGLNDAFKNLYAGSGRSGTEIADGLAKIRVETKLSGKELENLTAANLRFAKVTSSEVGSSIEQTQVLFQNWGVATSDQSEALDVLYATMTTAGMTAGELTAQMTALGPTARAFGLSFTSTAALVGSFDDAGLKASDMVRGLNALFVKFAKDGKNPQEALTALIDRMKAAKTTTEAVSIAISEGFTAKAAVPMADAVRRGALDFKKFNDQLLDSKGKVADVAAETKTFTENWNKLQHQLSIAVAPTGNFIVRWANDSMERLQALSGIMRGMYKYAGSLIGIGPSSPESAPATAPPSSGLSTPAPGAGGAPMPVEAGEKSHKYYALDSLGAEQLSEAIGRAKESLKAYADALNGTKEYGAEVFGDMSTHVLDFDVLVNATGADIAQMVDVPAKSFAEALSPAIRETEAAMHSLGIASTRELRAQYDAALLAAKAMVINGASVEDVGAAMEQVAEAHKKLTQRTGEWDNQLSKTGKTASVYGRQVSTAVNDVARSIADVLTLQKRWGDAAKDLGKSFIRIIAEDFINYGFAKLVKFIASDVLPSLGKVGKAIAGIINGGASGAANAAGGAASGAGSAAGGAGSAAGGAASGLMGTIGAVSAAVGAVSSVVGNFQMAGMNKSLDLIVNHTLRCFNELTNFRADAWTREGHWYARTSDMWATLLDIKDAIGRGGTGGGGKGGINFNNCSFTGSPDQIASAIFTQAQLAGVI